MNLIAGKKVLITAGPTHEPIDPVRFIGNRSSGKMSIAIADELARRGAEVELVLGPVERRPVSQEVRVHSVMTALDMYEKSTELFENADVAILAAAVADYRPVNAANQKIKSSEAKLVIELEKNPDIAQALGKSKQDDQIMIGFALETFDETKHAIGKLKKKSLDFIVLNSLNDSGAGFQHDTNKIAIIDKQGNNVKFELKSKAQVAVDILDYLNKLLYEKLVH